MNLPASISSILLLNDLPLGARLGTPRDAIELPDQLETGGGDRWSRARGSLSGDGLSAYVAWELDETGVLAQARADLGTPGVTAAVQETLVKLYSAKFGAPKVSRGASTWSVTAGSPAKLSLSQVKKQDALVIELTREKVKSPVGAPSSLVEFVLGPELLGAKFGAKSTLTSRALHFDDAAGPFARATELRPSGTRGKLAVSELIFPEIDGEAAFTQVFDELSDALTVRLGAPNKKVKKSGRFENMRGAWWVLEDRCLQLVSREHPNDDAPVRNVSVRACLGAQLSMAEQKEAGLR